MSDIASIRTKVIGIVKDDSGKLVNPTDYDSAIEAALTKYSRHKPFAVVDDITGDGTHQYDLPAGWSPEFSAVLNIEYPVGDVPPTLLDTDQYVVVDRSGTLLLTFDLAVAAVLRVTYTTLRTADDIADVHVDAFCWLAASYCLEYLADAWLHTSDSTIGADVVNYHSKSAEAAARAKRLRELYLDQLGIKADETTPAASAVADYDLKYPGGSERLTHPRWARRKR
jgi:hypothetical protein